MIGWIKTADRLPESYERCWVWDGVGISDGWFSPAYPATSEVVGDIVLEIEASDAVWNFECATLSVFEITHWMPYYTPEPPTE